MYDIPEQPPCLTPTLKQRSLPCLSRNALTCSSAAGDIKMPFEVLSLEMPGEVAAVATDGSAVVDCGVA